MLRRLTLRSLRSLAIAIVATAVVVAGSQLCGPGAEAAPSAQASQTRTVGWQYFSANGNTIIRFDAANSETIVTGAQSIYDLVVDPAAENVYWLNHNNVAVSVMRKAFDGSGNNTALVSTGISSPTSIAVDASFVYWSDTRIDTIKRAATASPHTVSTLADSSDGVSNPIRIAQDATYVYWLDSGNDSIRRVAKASPHGVTTLADSSDGISTPLDMVMSGDGAYLYWFDSGNDSIRRVATASPHGVDTVVTNTNVTVVDGGTNGGDLALSRDGDFVYWSEQASSGVCSRVIRRIQTNGAADSYKQWSTGCFEPINFAVDHAAGRVYLLYDRAEKVQVLNLDSGVVTTRLDSVTLRAADRIKVVQKSETVDGSCITDAGSVSGDYASIQWNADLSATCPQVFYTFRLTEDTDLRVTATSSAVNPVPILRQGGIGGSLVATTAAASGASTPYVYEAETGEYTVELARGVGSSQTTGSFTVNIQTQPALTGCDLNLGTLTSEPLTVFGAHDADCGGTRRYFFYLEYPAGVSVSANGQGFNPRIELRRSDATEASTALAQNTANPATLYSAVASGSYRINVEAITTGDAYELSFQAFGLPPPTRTPIPTPTPRLQANVDVRLEPNPQGIRYERDQVYRFRLEGGVGSFPAIIRLDNATDFALTTTDTLDCSAESRLQDVEQLDVVYLHVCAAATNANISVIKESDFSLLAQYPIYVPGEEIPIPDNVDGPGGYIAPPNDRIKLGVLIAAVCDGANVPCDIDLVRNGVGVAGSLFLFVIPTRVRRGRASGYSVGIGMAAFIIGLLLANALAGLPLWWAGIAFISVFALFGAGVYIKFRRFGS